MDALNMIFPIILYILGSVLLVCVIVLIVKLIYTVDKANEILDNVDRKVKTLDGLFNAIDMTTSTLSSIGDKLIGGIFNFFEKFSKNKKEKKKKEEEDFNE
ncbi:MAG: hypothetical protein ACI4OG_03080 [Bacilli bacterium]